VNVQAYKTRRLYHLEWCARYFRAALVCFVVTGLALPERRALVALAVGYAFVILGARERRRAFRVEP